MGVQTRTLISQVLTNGKPHEIATVCGWSKSVRKQGAQLCFIVLNDGSTIKNLQVVVNGTLKSFDTVLKCSAGCSFKITGEIVASPAQGQAVELLCRDDTEHEICVLGSVDAARYPLAKKAHSKEFLRDIGHLRSRTYLMSVVSRIRSSMAFATHKFFRDRGFLYIHTPIVTSVDCEGAGEMFQVTTLLPGSESSKAELIKEKKDQTEKREDSNSNNTESHEEKSKVTVEVDYKKDFFGYPTFLTVSSQLSLENYCCGAGNVYAFGPTFRAEQSHTSRHLAEFWMVEPEIAFADLNENMDVAIDYLKFCVEFTLNECSDDLAWLETNVEEGLIKRLRNVVDSDVHRLTYTDAIDILVANKSQFGSKDSCGTGNETTQLSEIYWGMDLASEHEKFITEKVYNSPVIIYNYPKEIKSFYMRLNDDGKTVAAMDVLVPYIGEIIGGSQREERLDVLDARIKEKGLPIEKYWWYRELRMYGTIPHSGFGLGFERLIMMLTGIENIRDVIPFPRFPGHAEF